MTRRRYQKHAPSFSNAIEACAMNRWRRQCEQLADDWIYGVGLLAHRPELQAWLATNAMHYALMAAWEESA